MRIPLSAAAAALLVAAGVAAALLWPDAGPDGRPGGEQAEHGGIARETAPDREDPAWEMRAKERIVERDAELTARLCSRQCAADLAAMAAELSRLPASGRPERLHDMRAGHPRLVHLSWIGSDGTLYEAGGLPRDAGDLRSRLREAREAVRAGKRYDSGSVVSGGERFAVLAVPAQDGGGVVGVVRQDAAERVKSMQTKHLRLVPYPREGRYGIESVDADTRRDITVDHGEENGTASHYHKHEVVVRFAKPPGERELERIIRDLAITRVRKTGYAYVFRSERSTAEAMMDYFRRSGNVIYAELHYLYMTNEETGGVVPNDMLYEAYQWNLPAIGTIPGWSISRGDDGVIVAVIDTGVDPHHPDLAGRLTEGANFVTPGEAPEDDVGHGTHVAGIIAAVVNNVEGVAGMTWNGRVMPIKVLDESGAGSAYAVAEGIIWAADNGARVINLSLGNYAESEFLHDAIRYAYDRGAVIVAAAGNDNTDQPGYPAAYPEVFGVSATDERGRLAAFSNYGDYIDAAAPGTGIPSTYPGGQYAAMSGTSMASPHAAALAALIRSVHPLLTNEEVMDIMRRTAVDLGSPGKDPFYGYGQIDVAAALEEAVRLKRSVGLMPEWVRREIGTWREP
jgi:type VII secretion-associated serine protease mycosin